MMGNPNRHPYSGQFAPHLSTHLKAVLAPKPTDSLDDLSRKDQTMDIKQEGDRWNVYSGGNLLGSYGSEAEAKAAHAPRNAPVEAEVRDLMCGVELRARQDEPSGPGMLVGYAAVFGVASQLLGDNKHPSGFTERIEPGAFRDVLQFSDVRALVNHDKRLVLGRSKYRTLRLEEDAVGLRYEVDLPDTTLGRDLAAQVRRGDFDGSSFSFTVPEGGDRWDYSGDVPVRSVRSVDGLYDVGPVTFPAYTDTRVALRALDASKPQPPPAPTYSLNLAKARLRLAEAL